MRASTKCAPRGENRDGFAELAVVQVFSIRVVPMKLALVKPLQVRSMAVAV